MGSGRDKRKKHKPKEAGVGMRKTEKKTEANLDKSRRRLEKQAQGGEDDIDSLLAQFKLKDEARSSIKVKACDPPSPRVFASFVPIPSAKENEAILYGGEWYDSQRDKTYVYSDVFVLTVDDKKPPAWRQVISPNGPLPRTSHQAVVHKGYMWVFGGEFTSLNQERFRHYNDLWRLNLSDFSWESMPSKGGPSARSGHRMAVHKNQIILFGGFFDTGKETRYYNDAWAFDLEDYKWAPLAIKPGSALPPPRGGHQLALHGDLLFVFGGYYVKKPDVEKESGYLPKSARRKKEDEEDEGQGITHGFDTVWCLDLKTLEWERVKKQGMAPGTRSSFGLVTQKRRAILFGGIFDREGAGDKMYSETFNELYQFNLETRRWFPLALRPQKKSKAEQLPAAAEDAAEAEAAITNGVEGQQQQRQQQQQQQEMVGSDEHDSRTSSGAPPGNQAAGRDQQHQQTVPGVRPELSSLLQKLAADKGSALHRAAVAIQSRFRGYRVRKAFQTYKLGGPVSELLYSPATYGLDLTADVIKPRARSAPQMFVLRNTLWLWGGNVEIAHTDVVLDDLWRLDLNKLDGWQCVQENTVGDDAFETASESEEEEGDESESD